jgi:hypothetical protein
MNVISFQPSRVRLSSSVRYAPMARWLDYSGVSPATTYLAIQRGQIKAKKHGRTLLIDLETGDAFLDQLPDSRPKADAPVRAAADLVPPTAA